MWPGPHCIRLPYQVASSSIQPFGYNRHEAKDVPLLGGAATPSNTTSPQPPGPRFTSVPSGTLIHPAVWPQRTLAENWGLFFAPLVEWEPGPRLTQCRLGREAYLCTKWHLDASSCLPFLLGVAGSASNTVAWAEKNLHTKWQLSPSSRLATTDIGRKLGAVHL